MILAVEDMIGEALARRLLSHIDSQTLIDTVIGRRGIGSVISRLRRLNEAAPGLKILAIIDRDRIQNCPSELITTWLGGSRHPNLVIRFADIEAESWIMADREACAEFLEVSLNRIPDFPDRIADPKQALVNLARRSKSASVRADLCPSEKAATAIVGPLYNDALVNFINSKWRPSRALIQSPSLAKAEKRITELVASTVR